MRALRLNARSEKLFQAGLPKALLSSLLSRGQALRVMGCCIGSDMIALLRSDAIVLVG